MTDATKVLLADPHPVARAGVVALVAAEPDMVVVGETGCSPDVVGLARRLEPAVVVCEADPPAIAGLRELGRKVLVLTGCADTRTMRAALAAGACGYLLKRATPEQLVQAIRAVAAGGTYLDPDLAAGVVDGFVGRAGEADVELSDREGEVLKLIARGYSNKEIGARLRLSVKTVETYKARAMEKLKVHSRLGIVAYAIRRGWLVSVAQAKDSIHSPA